MGASDTERDMRPRARIKSEILLGVLLLAGHGWAQVREERPWEFNAWIAGATGEETQNSFGQAQILSGGFSAGKVLTGEMGRGWRRGSLEYAFGVLPLFVQLRPDKIYGGGFEPLILRWNSGLGGERMAPYIELAGGAARTDANLPAGDTSDFNFTARGGGGIRLGGARRRGLDLGCYWWHISNANLGVKNPEFNGIQVRLGYHWFR